MQHFKAPRNCSYPPGVPCPIPSLAGGTLHSCAQEAFHPFLSLAGRVSDGFATAAFRQCWSSLPWSKATFHAAAPAALAELRAYLPSGDRAAVELLHGLDWALVLSKVIVGSTAQQAGLQKGG